MKVSFTVLLQSDKSQASPPPFSLKPHSIIYRINPPLPLCLLFSLPSFNSSFRLLFIFPPRDPSSCFPPLIFISLMHSSSLPLLTGPVKQSEMSQKKIFLICVAISTVSLLLHHGGHLSWWVIETHLAQMISRWVHMPLISILYMKSVRVEASHVTQGTNYKAEGSKKEAFSHWRANTFQHFLIKLFPVPVSTVFITPLVFLLFTFFFHIFSISRPLQWGYGL